MTDWSSILTQQSISLAKKIMGTTLQPICAPMQHHRLLLAKGAKVLDFLQGQLTCDIRRLEQGEVLLGAHCNAKGRMMSSMLVFKIDSQTVGLRIRANNAETTRITLDRFAAFSRVSIELSPMLGISLWRLPSKTDLGFPAMGYAEVTQHGCQLYTPYGYEYWAQSPQLIAFASKQDCSWATPELLEDHFIELGLTEVQDKTQEVFIPQMYNYDLIDGISFKKGCYTGQEIVARLHYKGQVKKRAFATYCSGAKVGDDVWTNTVESPVGTVVAAGANLATIVTAVENYTHKSPLHIEGKNPTKIEWKPLAYAIP